MAAASVDLYQSLRSSLRALVFKPNKLAVELINCHGPTAPTGETAVLLSADSMTAKYFNSFGKLCLVNTWSISGNCLMLLFCTTLSVLAL